MNVQLTLADGTSLPVDCCYVGEDDAGTHVWQVVSTHRPDVTGLTVDTLPPRTSIVMSLHLFGDEDDDL